MMMTPIGIDIQAIDLQYDSASNSGATSPITPSSPSTYSSSPFLNLPGELYQSIRESIGEVNYQKPEDEISTHLALREATCEKLHIYDERFWRLESFRHGIGGFDYQDTIVHKAKPSTPNANQHAQSLSWYDNIRFIRDQLSNHCGDEHLQRLDAWTKGTELHARYPAIVKAPSRVSFNPLVSSLFLNWWNSPSDLTHLSDRQRAISQAFFISSFPSTFSTTAVIPDVPPVPILTPAAGHLAIFSFATLPPISQLDITFEIGHNTDLKSSAHHPTTKWLETTIHLTRTDGVRIVDVIEGMYNWLHTPFTEDQQQEAIRQIRSRNPEVFARIEENTDEDTFAAWMGKTFNKPLSLIQGQYQCLTVKNQEATQVLSALVVLAPRDGDMERVATQRMLLKKAREIGIE
ncbi:hypothetical protein FRB99_000404 [Tulasnella sp. 403]|nr:hypothetical protein FRB99_000404 [Tulasnella sp. 403]